MSPIQTSNAIESLWLQLDREAEKRYLIESAEWTFRKSWEQLSEDAKSVWRKAIICKTSFILSLEKYNNA